MFNLRHRCGHQPMTPKHPYDSKGDTHTHTHTLRLWPFASLTSPRLLCKLHSAGLGGAESEPSVSRSWRDRSFRWIRKDKRSDIPTQVDSQKASCITFQVGKSGKNDASALGRPDCFCITSARLGAFPRCLFVGRLEFCLSKLCRTCR